MRNPNKNFYNFLLLWSGEFISAVGSGLTSFGLGVYVFEQTGQASAMALVTLLAFLPGLLLSVPAGVLADRYDRRLLMLLGDGLSAVGLIFILICVLRGGAQVWQICVGVTISSLFSALMDPAYKATVTDLLTPEQYTKASGLIGIAGSAKYLVSPILAGFLLTLWDISLHLFPDRFYHACRARHASGRRRCGFRQEESGRGFLQGTENRLAGSFAAQRCSAACPSFFSDHFFSRFPADLIHPYGACLF